MKVAPIIAAFRERDRQSDKLLATQQLLVHTGQHYDPSMSELFFDELGLPRPDVNLGIGSGSHGEQTGRIMEAFEKVLVSERPDLVMVVGDVNSTMACAIDAKKLGIPVAHVEAGLRSRDMTMPEEINRIVTDAISDLLFTTDRGATENLLREGIPVDRIHFVGNVMIDTLLKHRDSALRLPTLRQLGLRAGAAGPSDYVLVTLHRPSNVDDKHVLEEIASALTEIGKRMPVIFPVHPRTRAAIGRSGLADRFDAKANVRLLDPLGYLDFLNLQANACVVITDSGGIQEETTILHVPCLTVRPNTERPITVEQGQNRLVESNKDAIISAFYSAVAGKRKNMRAPELWDGKAADRIVCVVRDWILKRTG
jgi:UDP-N-acetylglucosamine 2-epimerase (non-hydrolysing)